MFRRNGKAWVASITAPVILIIINTVEALIGDKIPGLEGVVTYGVTIIATYAATWLVPNATS